MQVLLSVNPILTPWNSKYIVKQFPKRSIIAFPFPNSYSSLGIDFFFVRHFTRESNRRCHDQYAATTIETYIYASEQLHHARKWQFEAFPLHLGSSESRKTLEQKLFFQLGTLNSRGINERFSFN